MDFLDKFAFKLVSFKGGDVKYCLYTQLLAW